MIELIGPHGVNECDFIYMLGNFGEMFADPSAVIAVLLELIRRAEHLGPALDECEALPLEQRLRAGLHVEFFELGLEVE